MSLFRGETIVDALLDGQTNVAGFLLALSGGIPATTGSLYIVGNSAYDTNYGYLTTKYGKAKNSDGKPVFQPDIQTAIDACVDWRGRYYLSWPKNLRCYYSYLVQ